MAIFVWTGFNYGVLICLSAFLLIYQNTSGPVAWAYCAETCCDGALGMCLLMLYGVVVVLSLITEPLMNSALQPQGVFLLFSGSNLIGLFYMYTFVPETKGLTEAEKKKLFYPGQKYGRKLEEGEQPFVDEDEKEIETEP